MTAMHLPHRSAAATLGRHDALEALSDTTEWAFSALREWRRRIRERRQLAGLDDRSLRDIGITSVEREFLANKPFWRE
jgi:uncharacterized protein YjiS (DUF1127 family)